MVKAGAYERLLRILQKTNSDSNIINLTYEVIPTARYQSTKKLQTDYQNILRTKKSSIKKQQ